MSNISISRRDFLASTGGATLSSLACWSQVPASESNSPNEKLNIGAIGVSGRGQSNINGVQTENVVAICDIDEQKLGQARRRFPRAKSFVDWRKMLEDKTLDAVTVSTPDHLHALAAIGAMQLGKHVYCEKPLAHSIYEARMMRLAAAKHRVVTQLGNQLHASDRLRSVVELVRGGGLGTVQEVIAWSAKSGKRFSPGDRPGGSHPVPRHIHWDLWLGPAPRRPYHPTAYHPKNWRGWWDFGEGNLGDMACHIIDAPFWALDLGYPQTVDVEGPPRHAESAPPWLIVKFQFPASRGRAPVKLTWYDGTKAPPQYLVDQVKLPSQGALFVGQRGRLLVPHARGDIQLITDGGVVTPEFPEPTLPRPASHHLEWINACKTGGSTSSNFDYASRLTETALSGLVAYRTGKPLQWDGAGMRAANCPEAQQYIRPEMRDGWTL